METEFNEQLKLLQEVAFKNGRTKANIEFGEYLLELVAQETDPVAATTIYKIMAWLEERI